jgi:hypothetical protein
MNAIAEANGVVPAPMSTADLAFRLGSDRRKASVSKPVTTTAAPDTTVVTEGQTVAGEAPVEATSETNLPAEGTTDAGAAAGTETEQETQARLEAEATAAAAAEGAEGEEDGLNLEADTQLTPAQKKHVGEMFRERIGKAKAKYLGEAEAKVAEITGQLTAAEQRAQQLEQQLQAEQTKAPAPAATGNDPLANVTNEQQLATAVKNAKEVKIWAGQQLHRLDRAPDMVAAELKRMGVELADTSPQGMEEWLFETQERAEKTIDIHAPARKEFLVAEAQASAAADKRFPFLTNPKSPEYADAMGVLKTIPQLRQMPNWKVIVGVWARGLAAVKAEEAAAPKAGVKAPVRAVPPKIGVRPSAAARPVSASAAKTNAADTEFASTGSVEALAKTFASRR